MNVLFDSQALHLRLMLEQHLLNEYASIHDGVAYAARGCKNRDFVLSTDAIEPQPPRTMQVEQAGSL
ncbi:MAG TPA: hypothetical protein EYO33_06735 [Phycisphaerales bacterium]|nr:hypothetical protein [Phycisphaerales bacterium]